LLCRKQEMAKIVKCELDQIQLLTEVCKATFWPSHKTSAPIDILESYMRNNFSVSILTEELNNPKNQYNFLYQEGIVAGYSNIQINTPGSHIKAKNVTKLDRIYLLEEFFGQNLGADLLKFNIEWSKQHDQVGIWLYTWVKNYRAISFYEKNGFKIVGEFDFKITDTHYNPNHIMYLAY
jgi:ribosomal protein S18 acetylase RimI-like enzyme